MRQKIILAVALAVVGLLAGAAALAQNAAPPSLREQLEAQYQLTRMNGDTVVPGTVLVLLKEGVIGVPASNPRTLVVKYTGGALHAPSSPVLAQFGKDTRPLPKGEKVYVTKITVSLIEDWVRLQIVQCGACSGAAPAGSYSSVVGFQFAKGSLKKASVPDVEDTIAQVFDIYTPPPPPPKPPAPVVTVSESLAKSLQEKLSSIGRVTWSETTTTNVRVKRNKYAQVPSTKQIWEELSRVTINPRTCEMRMAWNSSHGDIGSTLFLEEVDNVEVLSTEEYVHQMHPRVQFTMSPTRYSVTIKDGDIKVPDAQTGNQIAGELRQLAQQCRAIPIPPPAANSGPSLADALHFVEDKLNDNGAVNYQMTVVNKSDGSPIGNPMSESFIQTQAAADPSTCLLRYRMNSKPLVISLRRVEKLEVITVQDWFERDVPTYSYQTIPAVYVLYGTNQGGQKWQLFFRDEEMANRVAKAMNHAVELCGTFGIGSTGPEPF